MATNKDEPELRSKSLTSINTVTSLGFPDADPKDNGNAPMDEDSYLASSTEVVCLESESHVIPKDIICLMLICEQHKTMAFKQMVNDCYFLPTFQFDGDSQSLSETVRNVINMHDNSLLSDESELEPRLRLVDLYRVELLKTRSYIQRYIFELVVHLKRNTNDMKAICICSSAANQTMNTSLASLNRITNSEDTVWISLQSVPQNLANIWGGEPYKIYKDVTGPKINDREPFYSYRFAFREINASLATSIQRSTDWIEPMVVSIRSNLPRMFDAAIEYLYNEFVVQCFPSNSMGYASFCIMLDKLGLLAPQPNLPNDYRKQIFRALDRHDRHFIDFEDLCIGLMQFESNNDVTSIIDRQGYIFRYYDLNGDNRLSYEEFKHLLSDLLARSNIDANLKRIGKDKDVFLKDSLDSIFVDRNSDSGLTFEQYLKAFESVNQGLVVNWWLPAIGFFEPIYFKFNCRNVAASNVQRLVNDYVYYNRCEVCDERRFQLSSSLIQLSDVGNILKIFHLKALNIPDSAQINFVEEFQEKNIYGMANEFLIRIEKIGMLQPNNIPLDQEEEDSAKNYFFPTRHKMLKYLHLILEHAKVLIESDPKVLELTAPCYIFGDVNGSLRDLLRFSQTVFRTFPFIDLSNLLFLGNYTDSDSAYNLECLIYLICLKIMSPTRIFLLRGSNELAGRQQINMQDKDKSDEPLNDIVCNLLAQIFDSFPIACIIEDVIYASHSGIPKDLSLSRMKMVCQHGSNARFTNTIPLNDQSLKSSVSAIDYEEEMEDVLLKVITGEPSLENDVVGRKNNVSKSSSIVAVGTSAESLYTNRDFELFLSSNRLFCAIRSHQDFKDVGYRMNESLNLATIVSASKGAKIPVCVYVDFKRIRLIRLDTDY